jgi:hypothetical protein
VNIPPVSHFNGQEKCCSKEYVCGRNSGKTRFWEYHRLLLANARYGHFTMTGGLHELIPAKLTTDTTYGELGNISLYPRTIFQNLNENQE